MTHPRRNRNGWLVNCVCHDDRNPSLSLWDGNDGRLKVHCFAGCDRKEILNTLRKMSLLDDGSPVPPTLISEPHGDQDDTERRIDRADQIWAESHPINPGDPVHRYLTGRGIILDSYPNDLHTHPNLDYWERDADGKRIKVDSFPAMLAVVRNPSGKPTAIHRTWVNQDGSGKAPVPSPKKIYKVYDLIGSSVRLFPPKDGLLAVCEGIEDALSAWVLWKISTWTALGTSGLKTFEPPAGITELLIFADKDENEAGQKAAWELADRMKMPVRVRVPNGHKDLNDLLLKGSVDEYSTGIAGHGRTGTSRNCN